MSTKATCACGAGKKVDPKTCSVSQVRKCHGDVEKHPCGTKAQTPAKNEWTTHPAKYEALLKRMASVAKKNGYVLNPDKARVEKVLGLMAENLVETGKPYCPCKQSEPIDLKKDVRCPCPTWKQEIAKDGHCFCRLFYRVRAAGKAGRSGARKG